jgi:hypothetical protein
MRARTPLEATRKFLDETKVIDDAARARVGALSADLRQEITARLVAAKDYEAYRLPSLMADIEKSMSDFRERYMRDAAQLFRDYAALGQTSVDAPLASIGVEIHLPASSLNVFQVAQRFSASLVKYVTEDTIARISREVTLAATGVQSPFEAIKKIERQIDDPLQFGTLQNRAETILRTEGGRVQSMAAQNRLEEARAVVPGLQKQWLWSGVSRKQHAAINGQVRDIDKPYNVPGSRYCSKDELMFPRDPSGLACQTINCACQSIPYKKEWGLEELT